MDSLQRREIGSWKHQHQRNRLISFFFFLTHLTMNAWRVAFMTNTVPQRFTLTVFSSNGHKSSGRGARKKICKDKKKDVTGIGIAVMRDVIANVRWVIMLPLSSQNPYLTDCILNENTFLSSAFADDRPDGFSFGYSRRVRHQLAGRIALLIRNTAIHVTNIVFSLLLLLLLLRPYLLRPSPSRVSRRDKYHYECMEIVNWQSSCGPSLLRCSSKAFRWHIRLQR